MLKRTFAFTGKIFRPIWGDIMWGIVTFLALALLYFGDWFRIRVIFGDALGLLIYTVAVLLFLAVTVFLFNLTIELLAKTPILKGYIGRTPNIQFVRAFVDERYIVVNESGIGGTLIDPPSHGTSERQTVFKSFFAHVVFVNKKRKLMKSPTAKEIKAHMRFANRDKPDLLGYDFLGRWANKTKQPMDLYVWDSLDNKDSIDIKQKGKEYILDIAMKPRESAGVLAFNNQNYRGTPELLSNRNWLSGDQFTVYVTLRGKNLGSDLEYTFILKNRGVGNDMDIQVINGDVEDD